MSPSPMRPGGLASMEDLDDLALSVALLVRLDRRLRERVVAMHVATDDETRTPDVVRATLLRLACDIAHELGGEGLFASCGDDAPPELHATEREIARALVARLHARGLVSSQEGTS